MSPHTPLPLLHKHNVKQKYKEVISSTEKNKTEKMKNIFFAPFPDDMPDFVRMLEKRKGRKTYAEQMRNFGGQSMGQEHSWYHLWCSLQQY